MLWSGPVHDLLVGYLRSYLVDTAAKTPAHIPPAELESELLMRWLNSICRILMNIQHYRHGGGLLITPANDARRAERQIQDSLRPAAQVAAGDGREPVVPSASAGRGAHRRGAADVLPYATERAAQVDNASCASTRTKCWAPCDSSPRCRASTASCCWIGAWSCTDLASKCAPTIC